VVALFHLARRLQGAGINLDWFPANVVLTPRGPMYVDHELNPDAEAWSFGNWGGWYWANRAGMAAFLRTGDPGAINDLPNTAGGPGRTSRQRGRCGRGPRRGRRERSGQVASTRLNTSGAVPDQRPLYFLT
jgi:hypothetical protein